MASLGYGRCLGGDGALGVALLVALSCGAVLAGCGGSECSIGSVECHGNQIWDCGTRNSDDPNANYWYKVDCGAHRTCRIGTVPSGPLQGSKQGICAAEPDPEPSCLTPTLDRRNNMSACTADGRAVLCAVGYVVEVLATCASPALCIAAATPATCVASDVPDPRCPADVPTHVTTCQGDHAVTCAAGYLVSDQDCGAGLCYTSAGAGTTPTCVVSTTPDPRCTAIAQGAVGATASGCTGNSVFTCVDNLYTHANDCGIDYCYQSGPGGAGCGQQPP